MFFTPLVDGDALTEHIRGNIASVEVLVYVVLQWYFSNQHGGDLN